MKKCKYCQSEIEAKAKICPVCHKKQGNKIVKWIVIIIIAIVVISVASGNSGDDSNSATNNSNNSSNNTDNSSNIVEKFSYEVTDQYSDGFSYYVEGIVTNNKDKNYSYVQIEFVCYDSEGNNLGTAVDNTNNLLGNETWKFKAVGFFSGGETVDHCSYHEVSGW